MAQRAQVMLSDFGLAVALGSTNPFAGTLRYAPDDVLEQLASHFNTSICSTPHHDLESLVKMFVEVLLEGDPRFEDALPSHLATPSDLLKGWQQVVNKLEWPRGLLTAARTRNYSRMRKLLVFE
jgi:serine/threonine protein kinase